MLPCPASAGQRLTCLEYQCLDFLSAHPEHCGNFLVRVIRELEENERGALVGRQSLHVIEQLAKVLTALDLIRDTIGGSPIGQYVVALETAAGTELGQAAVARDRVQPGPERHLVLASAQRAQCGDERQLERILGCFAVSEHMHAEREHATRISVIDRLERGVVARTQLRHKCLVGFVYAGPAIEPATEPGDCRAHPHEGSVRY